MVRAAALRPRLCSAGHGRISRNHLFVDFILITQNRITAEADKRADLDLHISLLAGHEISRLTRLVTEIARQMGIHTAENPELAELAQDVAPENILNTMETHRQQVNGEES
jgi:uncharacterized membrane protein